MLCHIMRAWKMVIARRTESINIDQKRKKRGSTVCFHTVSDAIMIAVYWMMMYHREHKSVLVCRCQYVHHSSCCKLNRQESGINRCRFNKTWAMDCQELMATCLLTSKNSQKLLFHNGWRDVWQYFIIIYQKKKVQADSRPNQWIFL